MGSGRASEQACFSGPSSLLTTKACSSLSGRPAKANDETSCCVIRLGKYRQDVSTGQGTSSVCYKGTHLVTGDKVAIKVWKRNVPQSVALTKFRRQIAVLEELQEPFRLPADPALWSPELEARNPADLFLQMSDYSKDGSGKPGVDDVHNEMYLIMELAEYSLRELIAEKRSSSQQLVGDTLITLVRETLIVVAGLHAKGFVHLDLKPDNLMMCSGQLKLIDVDGCVRAGSLVLASDTSISFSPCYCAPEWAQFLNDEDGLPIEACPSLDVWSMGMTICELVTQEPIMSPLFRKAHAQASSHEEAALLYAEWLGSMNTVNLPYKLKALDAELHDFVKACMLVPDKRKRKTLAECLSEPYVSGAYVTTPKATPVVQRSFCGEANKGEKSICRRKHRTLSRKAVLKTMWPA